MDVTEEKQELQNWANKEETEKDGIRSEAIKRLKVRQLTQKEKTK